MITSSATDILTVYQKEMRLELSAILDYWLRHSPDKENGGFFGHIDNSNVPKKDARKGLVLNSRILWAFSAAYLHTENETYLAAATRAFDYIRKYFVDPEFGGVYWSVNSKGGTADTRKQIYGLAFCIYGLAEYFRVAADDDALSLAQEIFREIEQHSFDPAKGGYFEAFTRDWKIPEDLRLSDKDDNEKKTMNTHLHLIEAYANLYQVWPAAIVTERVGHLLDIFTHYIIDHKTGHLHLFMDENWAVKSTVISYGHDIEAAWLLLECAGSIGGGRRIDEFRGWSLRLAAAAAEGIDGDGGLWYEYEPTMQQMVKEKHSWPQAEAMVGFFNAYQLSGDASYLDRSYNSWRFVRMHIRDNAGGEWFWGVDDAYRPLNKEKAGFWKCPYHNSRACLELIKRIDQLTAKHGTI